MTSDAAARWQRLRALLETLVELSPAERETHLAGLDAGLAAQARELLARGDAGRSLAFEGAVAAGAAAVLASFANETSAPASPDGPAADGRGAHAGLELGPWRLERPLGRGGMAEVWEARRADGQFEQTVAIKLLKRGMDSEEIVARFLRERQILARLEHPGIARLFDGGVAPDGRPYFVLERVDGEPITDWCRGRGLDVTARLRLLVACCEAVDAAHRQLVVHRDLKPSNILVTPEGPAGTGHVKLLDFGIAKLLAGDGGAGHATRAEVRVLTPSYAAPEQILGEPVSTATDVYALGVLAYELLTGRLPYQRRGRGAAELAVAVQSEALTRPSTAVLSTMGPDDALVPGEPRARRQLSRAIAGDLDTIVIKALQRQPERRYSSVAALAEDVERFLDGRPIRARPDSVRYRAAKYVRRHRLGIAAASLVALSLLGGTVVALWQADRARSAAAAAQQAAVAAEAEAAESAAIATFLTDVFTAADPEGKRAADLTARELVQRGAARIDTQLAAQPATHAQMLHVLGTVQYRLGLYEPARELLEKGLALRRALSPPAPADVAASAAALGLVYHRQGRSADALPLVEEALAYHQRAGSAATRELIDDLSSVANVYRAVGRDGEARTAFERAIALLERTPDADPSQLAKVLNNYGLFLDRNVRDPAGARVALERALALHERNTGPDSALVSGTLSNLSEVYIRLHAFDQAVAASRRAVAIAEKTYGAGHLETGVANNGLGWALLAAGRPAEARDVLTRAIEVMRVAVGEHHRAIGYPYRNLGQALAETAEPDAALAMLRRAEEAWSASLGPEAQELGTVYILRAHLLAARSQADEAERLLARTVELWRKDGPQGGRLGEAWLALARVRLHRCRIAAAQEALRGARSEAASHSDKPWAAEVPALERELASTLCPASDAP